MPIASAPSRRPVLVTGLGVVSGFGVGAEALWAGLSEGRSCLRPIGAFDPSGFPSRLAGELDPQVSARDFVPKHYRKATKVMARDSELAVIAAHLAVQDAGILTRAGIAEGSDAAPTISARRTGCQIGAGLIAAETDELAFAMATARDASGRFDLRRWGTVGATTSATAPGGMNNLTPLWMLKYLPNMLACHVTIIHGCEGPSNTHTCSESSGLLCLGESLRVIQRGDADLCFSGGAEAPINLMRFMRMEFSGRLAPTGDLTDGSRVVRPFDRAGTGTLLGDGGGILLLESEESARSRGAKVYAEVAGFGAGHSPALWTARENGVARPWLDEGWDEGLVYAIQAALDDAGLGPSDIDAIVPHGSGIPCLDSLEIGSLRRVFGARAGSIPLITITPATGSSLAGHGSLMAAAGALSLAHQALPARLHAGQPGPDIAAGPAEFTPCPMRNILLAGGSLAGHSAAIVLRRVPTSPRPNLTRGS